MKNIHEQLKDRRDYRAALIHKKNETETKIKRVESQIKTLRALEEERLEK